MRRNGTPTSRHARPSPRRHSAVRQTHLVSILLGGVAAHRLPRRALLMVVVEAVRVGTVVIVGLLAMTGQLPLWQLAVVGFVIGTAEALYFTAYTEVWAAALRTATFHPDRRAR